MVVLVGAVLWEHVGRMATHRISQGWLGVVGILGPRLLGGRHEGSGAGERVSPLIVIYSSHVEIVVVQRQVVVSVDDSFMPMQGGGRLI